MKRKRKIILAFRISVFCMGLLAFSFLCMPISSDLSIKYQTGIPLIIVGSIFWGSLILGYSLFTYINILRDKRALEKSPPGIIRFFTNKLATIVDIMMLVFLLTFICGLIWMNGYILYVLLSLCVFCIQFHAVLNGKNFEYIQYIQKGEKQ